MPGGAIVGLGIVAVSLIKLLFYLIKYLNKRRRGEDTDGYWTGGLGCGTSLVLFLGLFVYISLCFGSLLGMFIWMNNPVGWILLLAFWAILTYGFYKILKSD